MYRARLDDKNRLLFKKDDPVAKLVPPNAFKWPPHEKRDIQKSPSVICPDIRTAMLMKIEAVDLSENGYDTPYFRREMMILDKVLEKPGIKVNKIINQFSKKEIEEIYPALSPVLLEALCEELELMGFLKVKDKKATVTKKGKSRFRAFKNSLTKEERAALQI